MGDCKSVWYCITLHCFVSYWIALCHTVLHCAILDFIVSNVMQMQIFFCARVYMSIFFNQLKTKLDSTVVVKALTLTAQ